MGDAGVGWIAAIIIGGIAGWLAEQFMKSNMGLIMGLWGARSAGSVPTVGKRDKWPSYAIVIRCFGGIR